MNAPPAWQSELHELLDRLHEDQLSESDCRRLNELLASGKEQRDCYISYMDVHSLLAWNADPRSSEAGYRESAVWDKLETEQETLGDRSADREPRFGVAPAVTPSDSPIAPGVVCPALGGTTGFFSSGWPVAYLVAAAVFIVGGWIAASIYISRPNQIARRPGPTRGETIRRGAVSQPVGRIVAMSECRWTDPSGTPTSSRVTLGCKYDIRSGAMEIAYDTGARVILQGPAIYEVHSASGGTLSFGKLTARLEKRGERREERGEKAIIGSSSTSRRSLSTNHYPLSTTSDPSPLSPLPSPLFVVRTPTAVVTDLGTEFGVAVDERGATTSHVFRGSVRVQWIDHEGIPQGVGVVLHENESTQVARASRGGGAIPRRASIDPATFVRSEQFTETLKNAEDPRLTDFRRWETHRQNLRRDPSLLAYYDFQRRDDSPTVLHNVASNGGPLDGTIENAAWCNGRMAGKHALQFKGPDDCVRIDLPKEVDDLTIAAWVCVDSLHYLLNGLVMSDGWNAGNLHWQIHADGRVQFAVNPLPGGPFFSASAVFDRERLHRWTHLAVVYDHASGRLTFYVDGRLSNTIGVFGSHPIRIGAASLGNWRPAPGDTVSHPTVRSFRGRIDELAIFGRAMDSDWVRQMYEAGSPEAIRPTEGKKGGVSDMH